MPTTTTTLPNGGRLVRHENSNGAWHTYAYNAAGQETHYADSTGVWTLLVKEVEYTLRVSADNVYWAGCRMFTREQALAHWGVPRYDNEERAALFVAAINNYKEQ